MIDLQHLQDMCMMAVTCSLQQVWESERLSTQASVLTVLEKMLEDKFGHIVKSSEVFNPRTNLSHLTW